MYDTGRNVGFSLLEEALALFRELSDQQGMGLVLLSTAALAHKQGRLVEAATLLGALDHLLAEGSVTFKPPDRSRSRSTAAAVEAQLPAVQFATAWQQGQQLGLEDALNRALT